MTDEPFDGDAAGYRPVSGSAVAALVAGCCSGLVLFTPLAAVVPLVAIVMAVAALAGLRRAESRRVGRLAAVAGLALAIGFTAQALAGAAVARWIAAQRATATAEAWIEAVRNRELAAAMRLCSGSALPATGRGDPFEPPPSEAERLAAFQQLAAIAAAEACGEARPGVAVEPDPATTSGWVARADLARCGSAEGRLVLRVEPRASLRGRTPVERWLVTSIELDP